MKNFGAGVSIARYAKQLFGNARTGVTRWLLGLFKTEVTKVREDFNKAVKDNKYDLLKSIDSAKKEFNAGWKLRDWVKDYAKDHTYKGVLLQGYMYYFHYPTPKYADELEYYDPFPLIICFSVQFKATGNLVEYGINLHYLPFEIRKLVLNDIFDLIKDKYDSEFYSNEPRAINAFTYGELRDIVDKYGIDFAVRSYIPSLRKATIQFDYQDWSKAILIETKGFKGISQRSLMRLYYQHVANVKRNR